MPDFDIIVVGGGCAGSVAAYTAATAGKSVLVVERGNYAGAKNMTGGRIYAHSLKRVFPDFEQSAPLERKITHERIAMLDFESQTAIDFTSVQLADEDKVSYSVLRGPFDQWLAEQAEDAGAEYIYGIPVDGLIKDEAGKVLGISAGEDKITSQVLILAEGANSLLSERCLGNARPKPHEMAMGIKEVFELSASCIEDRFLVKEGEGAAMLFVGDCTKGKVGGGFLYTNAESISLGLVVSIAQAADASNATPVYQMLDDFKRHPAVAPILAGARLIEHSGHMVPEGGYKIVPRYVFDGALIAGDAAMLCMNLGYQVRGMDFAVASGRMAAEAAIAAIDTGDVSAAGLDAYRAAMENSFVLKDLTTFKLWPETMERWTSFFTDYPRIIKVIFNKLFSVDGSPQQHLRKRIWPIIKKYGPFRLLKEIRGAYKTL
jgi:electron transfer flavoprotein-quinone oxidoreductase